MAEDYSPPVRAVGENITGIVTDQKVRLAAATSAAKQQLLDKRGADSPLLRAGLRWIVDEPDRQADARRRARRRVAPRPSIQSVLLDDQPDLFESESGPTG